MPVIIDYSRVLEHMTAMGYRCNYYNSGAFGFKQTPLVRGWIGPDDPTIKPELRADIRSVPPPYEAALAYSQLVAWQKVLPGNIWLMPMSHWHFEFHDGSRDWLASQLIIHGVDVEELRDRADGSALEFGPEQGAMFSLILNLLLRNLRVSDFMIAFPGHPALCTVHHNKQLWWMTNDAKILEGIDKVFTECALHRPRE
jgi:hypothetical protein